MSHCRGYTLRDPFDKGFFTYVSNRTEINQNSIGQHLRRKMYESVGRKNDELVFVLFSTTTTFIDYYIRDGYSLNSKDFI